MYTHAGITVTEFQSTQPSQAVTQQSGGIHPRLGFQSTQPSQAVTYEEIITMAMIEFQSTQPSQAVTKCWNRAA